LPALSGSVARFDLADDVLASLSMGKKNTLRGGLE
jgi:hypothetical protein